MSFQQIETAIAAGDLARLRALLSGEGGGRGGNPLLMCGTDRRSIVPPPLLHMAAVSPRKGKEMIKILLNAGMNINQQDHDGRTALHVSVRELNTGTRHVFTTLLIRHYDPFVKDASGETVLHALAKKPFYTDLDEMIRQLLLHIPEAQKADYIKALDNRRKSAIHYAIDSFAFNRVRHLLHMAAVSFVGDPTGTTLLHDILRKFTDDNETEVRRTVMLLLKRGCDVTARDESGQTALHIFARYSDLSSGSDRFVMTIISTVPKSERTAFLETQDDRGATALHAFAKKKEFDQKSDIVRIFLEHEVDPTVTDSNGYPPLFYLGVSYRYWPFRFDSNAAFLLLQNMLPVVNGEAMT